MNLETLVADVKRVAALVEQLDPNAINDFVAMAPQIAEVKKVVDELAPLMPVLQEMAADYEKMKTAAPVASAAAAG